MARLLTLPVYKGYSNVPHKINIENHKEKFDEYCKVKFIDRENKGSKAITRKFLSHLREITALKISVPNLSTVIFAKHMTYYMVAYDHCNKWFHDKCVNYDTANIPCRDYQ